MALVNTENVSAQLRGFSRLPALRQVALMIGLAASVALGVAVVLWSQEPNYSLLYSGMSNTDAAQVLEALDGAGIPYKLERGSSAVMVPSTKVHTARLKLATLGLPKSSVTGLEFLDKQQTLGTSRLIETARYHRALAGELSRTISALDSVESARVHLAIPKQSVFVRNRSKPSASVLLNLYPGRQLDDARIAGIVHMVASSIPELEAEQVTVVDQKGRLLTADRAEKGLMLGSTQLNYRRRLEEAYVKRIMAILTPIVGADGVRAQVATDLDFSSTEKTSETFNPDPPAVRSEQIDEQQTAGADPVGIPGALSNQPPAAGTLVEQNPEQAQQGPRSTRRRSTRNYELDRTLSHTRTTPGSVQRLSIAVVVDYRTKLNDKGEITRAPLEADEMEYITSLVKKAVGFNEDRGDSVNVINASFKETPEIEQEAISVWQQPWLFDVVKQALGVLAVLLLVFGVLRPVLKSLAEKGKAPELVALAQQGEQGELPVQDDQLSLGSAAADPAAQLDQARSLVQEDPKRVAQVVKTWIAAEDG